jgi:hypothetical protein
MIRATREPRSEEAMSRGAQDPPDPAVWQAPYLRLSDAERAAGPEDQERRIEDFLDEVYRLASLNDIEGATDRIFDHIDRLLSDGAFIVCDEILRRVDVEKLPTALMRSFLTITAAAKDKLPWREALYQKVERKMIQLKGEEKTKRIIGRLA